MCLYLSFTTNTLTHVWSGGTYMEFIGKRMRILPMDPFDSYVNWDSCFSKRQRALNWIADVAGSRTT